MPTPAIGSNTSRVEGRAKVTGRAHYAADHPVPGVVFAYPIVSTIASGRVEQLDTNDVAHLPGVLGVWSHANFPSLYRSPNDMAEHNRVGEVRPPFEDDRVYYAGQFVGVLAAETFEQARAAARQVRVTYRDEARPAISLDRGESVNGAKPSKDKPDVTLGDLDAAWAGAAVKVDATYVTPTEVHNPMELHATIARWTGGKLEVFDSTQWVVGQKHALAKVLGVPAENISVYAPYVGGGFGGKLFLWPHTVVAAVVARELKRPVKLVLERKNEFTTAGHRPETRQRLRVAAKADGTLVGLAHESLSHTSLVHDFLESCGDTTSAIYRCPNIVVTHRTVATNVGSPTSMRAPGAASGSFALESAMDEMAVALRMDPFDFRLKNLSLDQDVKSGLPWSSNHLRECLQIVRERSGWNQRTPDPGSMRDGHEIIGWGMAVAAWPSNTGEAQILVELRDDGTARVSCATQDIGTGTYTVLALVAAEVLGLPVEKIAVTIGDSSFPPGPISGGSMVTATVVPVAAQAARQAIQSLFKMAIAKKGPFPEKDVKSLTWTAGVVAPKDGGQGVPFADILKANRLASVDGEGRTAKSEDGEHYMYRSFGAHVVEVRWDPDLGRLHVARVVSAFDCGRVISRKAAENQAYGSIVMGLGMAKLEEAVYDGRTGRVVTDNLADYLMPINADTPEMDLTLIDQADPHIGEFGAKGIGEVGITGIAAAIANAVYHATGKRIRELPIHPEKLLG